MGVALPRGAALLAVRTGAASLPYALPSRPRRGAAECSGGPYSTAHVLPFTALALSKFQGVSGVFTPGLVRRRIVGRRRTFV